VAAWHGYKMFPSSLKSLEGINVEARVSMQEQPVQSAIITPKDKASVWNGGPVELTGYAWSGGGRGIVLVDVSADGGKTWIPATLGQGSEQKTNKAWAWTFWSAEVPISDAARKAGTMEVLCRATDAASNTQPETPAPIWNLRGLANNSWHRINIYLTDE